MWPPTFERKMVLKPLQYYTLANARERTHKYMHIIHENRQTGETDECEEKNLPKGAIVHEIADNSSKAYAAVAQNKSIFIYLSFSGERIACFCFFFCSVCKMCVIV